MPFSLKFNEIRKNTARKAGKKKRGKKISRLYRKETAALRQKKRGEKRKRAKGATYFSCFARRINCYSQIFVQFKEKL